MTITIQTPDWVKHAVFYQIFPDRFAIGTPPAGAFTPSLNLEPWEEPPTRQGYKGGNLWGVIEKLDYIASLGVTAIYFTPIFQSASNHRYHTHDYYQVDPLLGGNEALQALLKAAHDRDIKIVLDGVFNHCSRGFFYFNDILENGPHSPWLDWFKVTQWPVCAYDGNQPANYESWWDNRALPEFNHNNPDVQEYIMQIGEYWLHQGIDGWRLDVPMEVETPGFWEEFRQRVKAVNPEAYIVGEIWRDATQWLQGDQFDGVMNYLFTGATLAFVGQDRVQKELVDPPAYDAYPALTAAEYRAQMTDLIAKYPWEIQLTQLNLLSSHDTARVLSIFDGDKAGVKLTTLLLLTFPGAPSIYYGDEVGLPGKLDPDCRRVFPQPENWDRDLLTEHQKLIALRHEYPALRIGDYQPLYAEGLVYGFQRVLSQMAISIYVNGGTEPASVPLPSASWQLLWGDATVGDELNLPPRNGCILIARP